MDMDQLIYYVNLYFNKTKNYCIDYIFHEIIYSICSYHNKQNYEHTYDYYFHDEFGYLKLFDIDYKDLDIRRYYDHYDLNDGYCCSDCDGDLKDYTKYRYIYRYLPDYLKSIENHISKFLKSKRNNYKYEDPQNKQYRIF
jgi:hypothetical protein